MNKSYKVDRNNTDFEELAKLHRNGYQLVCAKCNSNLAVALTLEEANERGIVPGIYCPNDGSHVYIHIYTCEARDKIWDKIKKQD